MPDPIITNELSALLNTGIAATIAILAFRWITTDLVNQMQRSNEALIGKITEMITCFYAHDQQAKTILQTDLRIENTLANRPCIKLPKD